MTQAQEAVLPKRHNCQIPVQEIITGAEAAVDHLLKKEPEELRQDVDRKLKTRNQQNQVGPKNNFKHSKNLDMEEYITKMEDILRDKAYKQINRELEKTTKTKI